MEYPALPLWQLWRPEYLATITALAKVGPVTLVLYVKDKKAKVYRLRYPVPPGTDVGKVTLTPVTFNAVRAGARIQFAGWEFA